MILRDYHVHSCFCDGKSTPEEIVVSAISKGMEEIGILTHSHTDFDESFCIQKERVGEFTKEIHRLKEKYKENISILCGVEQDILSTYPTDSFDYVIGSSHYVKCNDKYIAIDDTDEVFRNIVEEYYNGDYLAVAEEYFSNVSKLAEITKPDIIGHFDLVSKFNENGRFFSETDERYVKAYRKTLDVLLKYNIPFEINTGAISRGYRTSPYPNNEMVKYIKEHGGKMILSSDSHHKNTLCFEFEKWEKLL